MDLYGVYKDWVDCTAEEKAAITTLGWSAASWDGGETTPFERSEWEGLSAEEQKAAELLGTDESYFGDVGEDTSPFEGEELGRLGGGPKIVPSSAGRADDDGIHLQAFGGHRGGKRVDCGEDIQFSVGGKEGLLRERIQPGDRGDQEDLFSPI